MLYEKTGRRLCDTERRIYYSDDTLPSPLITVIDPSHSFRMTFYRPLSLRTGQKKNLHSILLRRSHKPVSSVRLRRPPPYKQGGLPNPYSSRQNPFPQHCSKSFVGALNDALPYPVIQSGSKNAVWEWGKITTWHRAKNLLPWWRLTVLYKDHGVGRQKELLAHAVRLRILACRNDLNRKRIVSLQLTAHSW